MGLGIGNTMGVFSVKQTAKFSIFSLVVVLIHLTVSQSVRAGQGVASTPDVQACKYALPYTIDDDATWSGACKDGFLHGYGELVELSAEKPCRFSGDFIQGQMEGYAEIQCWTDAFGEWEAFRYQGDVKAGEQTGYGLLSIGDSMYYMGHLENGDFHGFGELRIKDYYLYGNFTNSQLNGHGFLKYKDLYNFMGVFKDGEVNGPGVLDVSAEFSLMAKGNFRGTMFQSPHLWEMIGPGQLIYASKNETYSYIGEIQELGMHGRGVQIYDAHAKYEGEFADNSPNGSGVVYDTDGNSCEGRWDSGKMVAKGMGFKEGKPYACTVDKKLQIEFFLE